MSPHRITKKEIKQDKFVTFSLKLSEWVQKHLNQVLMAAGGIIVAAALVVFLITSHAKKERMAAELFGQANLELQSGNIGAAVSDLQTLISKYGGSGSAGQATYYLASAYFFARDYAQSQSWFESYLDKYHDDNLLTSSAHAGIADCYEQQGEYLQAGDSFLKAVSAFPSGFLAPQYLLQAAYAFHKAGEKNRASEALGRIVSEYPDSKEAQRAKLKLAEML